MILGDLPPRRYPLVVLDFKTRRKSHVISLMESKTKQNVLSGGVRLRNTNSCYADNKKAWEIRSLFVLFALIKPDQG